MSDKPGLARSSAHPNGTLRAMRRTMRRGGVPSWLESDRRRKQASPFEGGRE